MRYDSHMNEWVQTHKKAIVITLSAVVVVLWGGLGVWWWVMHGASSVPTSSASTASPVPEEQAHTDTSAPRKIVDLTKLPLGDGKVGRTAQKGYIMRCGSGGDGGGAQKVGEWIHGNTWDKTAKPTVDGDVAWPAANVSIVLSDDVRKITGNGLPVGSNTGVFPIKKGTVAYTYDANPNSIKTQVVQVTLAANPALASSPSCLSGGPIGYMTNGVALFDGLDAEERDAPAHEIQDKCEGHPQPTGIYHYHDMSDCVPGAEENNQLIGYALDGFGIFSSKDAQGNEITSDDLDECHGTTGSIMWDGKMMSMYHYVMTHDYPYSLGCFKGRPVTATQNLR